MLDIIYEDNSIIVINKPQGLATQSANIAQKDCLSLIKEHLKKTGQTKTGEPYVGLVHRLDQPVAGLLVFAKNEKAAASLSKQVQTDFMNKKYYALVEGRIEEGLAEDISKEGGEYLLENYIYKDSKNSKAVIVNKNQAKNQNAKVLRAALKYKVEKYYEGEDVTLLDIKLLTGRFHQIRAQLSNLNHPIINDRKYGSQKQLLSDCTDRNIVSGKGIALKAYELSFRHPDNNKEMTFSLNN